MKDEGFAGLPEKDQGFAGLREKDQASSVPTSDARPLTEDLRQLVRNAYLEGFVDGDDRNLPREHPEAVEMWAISASLRRRLEQFIERLEAALTQREQDLEQRIDLAVIVQKLQADLAQTAQARDEALDSLVEERQTFQSFAGHHAATEMDLRRAQEASLALRAELTQTAQARDEALARLKELEPELITELDGTHSLNAGAIIALQAQEIRLLRASLARQEQEP